MAAKKLFLSKRLVTENEILDGGILVNENGVIESILSREEAEKLVKDDENIQVGRLFTFIEVQCLKVC